MDSKTSQVQTQSTPQVTTQPKPEVKVHEKKEGPCASQYKEYEKCLTSFSYYFTNCKTQQTEFKSCSEFDKWLENSVQSTLKK